MGRSNQQTNKGKKPQCVVCRAFSILFWRGTMGQVRIDRRTRKIMVQNGCHNMGAALESPRKRPPEPPNNAREGSSLGEGVPGGK